MVTCLHVMTELSVIRCEICTIENVVNFVFNTYAIIFKTNCIPGFAKVLLYAFCFVNFFSNVIWSEIKQLL